MMKKILKRILLEILVVIVITQLLNLVTHMYQYNSIADVTIGTLFGIVIGMVMLYGHRLIGKEIRKRTSWLQSPIKTVFLTVASGALFTIVAMAVLNLIFFVVVLKVPIEHFSRPNWFGIKIAFWMYLISMIIAHTIVFYVKWKNLAIEQEKQKNEALRLQFEALKTQVNPHFLFNSLNTLAQLIETDKDKAIDFTNRLSESYRYIIDKKNEDLVPLSDELAFVDSYLQLQKIRYGEMVEIHNVKKATAGFFVIPVSIQMLVENVFKHNIISKESKVVVEMWIEANYFHIKNNLNPKPNNDESTSTGLANIRSRYEYLTDRTCIFEVRGDVFFVAIPLISKYSVL